MKLTQTRFPFKWQPLLRRSFGYALALLGAWLVLLVLVYFRQAQMLYLPDLPTRELAQTPAALGLAFEDVMLNTRDGEKLHGWYLPAAVETPATVLILHGNAGNISHRLETLRIFHALGLNAVIIDYRGYGNSSGRPEEAGTYEDARTAWRYLVETRAVPPARIALFGRSLGGAIAARLATEVEAGAVIVESAFTSVPDIAAELYPWLPARKLSRFSYDTRSHVQDINSPLLVIHSRDDEIIPFHHGERIHANAAAPKTLLELRGSHNTAYLDSGARYTEGLQRFLAPMLENGSTYNGQTHNSIGTPTAMTSISMGKPRRQ